MRKNSTPSRSERKRERAVSNIMGIALGIALTIGMAGAVAYFATQETNILTTQEGFGIVGPKLLHTDNIDILSLSIKNIGTSPIKELEVKVLNACKKTSDGVLSDETVLTGPQSIKPGATHGISVKVADTCPADHESNIEPGNSYIVEIKAVAAGTESKLYDTFTVTSRY